MRPRCIRVHLRNDGLGRIHCTTGHINGHTQGTITVLIGDRDLHNGHINRQDVALEQFRDLTQKHRNIIGPTLIHCLANCTRHKHGIEHKGFFVARLGDLQVPINRDGNDLHIPQPIGLLGQLVDDEYRGLSRSVHKDTIARFNN